MTLFFYLNRTLTFPFPKFSYYAIVQKEQANERPWNASCLSWKISNDRTRWKCIRVSDSRVTLLSRTLRMLSS